MNEYAELIKYLISSVVGFMFGLLTTYLHYRLTQKTEKGRRKFEKLEEAFRLIKKTKIIVSTVQTDFLRGLKDLPRKLGSIENELPQEHLIMILTLYNNEFKDEVAEFEKAFKTFGDEILSIMEEMAKGQMNQQKLAELSLHCGSQLLVVCDKISEKIANITRKEFL
jgi:hypothetical protein